MLLCGRKRDEYSTILDMDRRRPHTHISLLYSLGGPRLNQPKIRFSQILLAPPPNHQPSTPKMVFRDTHTFTHINAAAIDISHM